MSAIPISEILPVSANIVAASGNNLSLAGLVLTKNKLIPNNKDARVLMFRSSDQVAKYFGSDSEEYKQCNYYFNGYDNSLKSPDFLMFARYINAAQNAYIRSDSISAPLADFIKVKAGAIDFMLNGNKIALTALDFSTAKSYSDVAGILQTALVAAKANATVGFNALYNGFIVEFTGDGKKADSIEYCIDGELASLLQLTEKSLAVLSQGSLVQTPAENMNAIKQVTTNWVGCSYLFDADIATVEGLMEWFNAENSKATTFALSVYSNEAKGQLSRTQQIANLIKQKNYSGIVLMYGYLRHALFVLGIGASIDYEASNATLTFAFKQQSGLDITVDTKETSQKLDELGFNYCGAYSSRADNYTWLMNGVITGVYSFIDNFYNQAWLLDQLQVAEAELLGKNKAVGYDPQGDSDLFVTYNGVMLDSRDKSVCSRGIAISESQRIQLRNILGFDPSSDIYSNGYFIYIPTPTAKQRAERKRPATSILYAYRGAVHMLPVNVTLVI